MQKLGLLSLEKRKFHGDLIATFQNLKGLQGPCREVVNIPSSGVLKARMDRALSKLLW